VTPRRGDCAAAPASHCSRPRRGPAEGDTSRRDRGSRKESWLQIEEGTGEGQVSADSEGLKVNGLRGFARSTLSRGTASSAGSEQSANSSCRGLDRARRPSCSNESVGVEKVGSCGGGERGTRIGGSRPRARRGRLDAVQGEGGKEGKDIVGGLGVKVADDEELRGRAGRDGVLIDDVEKQRLDEARAPCPSWRRQTRTSARHARRGLAKPTRAGPPGTRAPLTVSSYTLKSLYY